MQTYKTNSFLNWFKQPSSWLSLIATFISLTAFYFMNLSAGSLVVQLPEEVGVRLNSDSTIDMVVPVVFYNTGAPRRQRIVTAITATLVDTRNQVITFRWVDTYDFMGKLDFESRYPKLASPDVQDYVLYKSRSVPFIVSGGTSDYKVVHLSPLKSAITIRELSAFELALVVKTNRGNFEVRGSYSRNKGLTPDEYVWFTKAER